jgi:glycosyltransferase involved in cell wall biosynthesis
MIVPSIAIVTPSLNQAPFLERAIRSVLDQRYPRLEYVVLDGGSTDDSADIIARYSDRLARWRSAPDQGQAAAVNEGWGETSGEILGWINSDDYYLPGSLDFIGRFFRSNEAIDLAYGTCRVVDSFGSQRAVIGEPTDRRRMQLGHQPMPQPSTFMRRRLYEAVGPVDESLRYAMDYDLFLRAVSITSPVFVDRPLAAFTVQPLAKTFLGRARARQETLHVALRYASGNDRTRIRFNAARAALFHSLPSDVRRWVDARRRSPINL